MLNLAGALTFLQVLEVPAALLGAARRHNADPSTEGLADQQRQWKIREDDWGREAQERVRQHEFWATKARNLSAWAPKGMG